jgi:hypothetical protein
VQEGYVGPIGEYGVQSDQWPSKHVIVEITPVGTE